MPDEKQQPHEERQTSSECVRAEPTNHAGARDILLFRGAEFWPTPEAVIREVHVQGLSGRIARNHIPEGLIHGLSRIVLAHAKAVMTIANGTEPDLFQAFRDLHDAKVDEVLALKYEHASSRWLEMPESAAKREIFRRLGVEFGPGIFAYSYWTGTSYYLKPDEHQAPADLKRKGVEAVRGVIAATGEALPLSEEDGSTSQEDGLDET